MWLLEDWPDRLVSVMSDNQMKSYVILQNMTGQVPFWFNSIVTKYFYATNASRHFIPLRFPLSSEASLKCLEKL